VFSNPFRKSKPYTEVSSPATSLHFQDEPTGNGLAVLKDALASILATEGNTSKAYLRRVHYPSEQRTRVALVIDGKKHAEVMAAVVAKACQPLVAIDIIFFESLNSSAIQEVECGAPPFYVAAGA
jgi:hypothetical protein